MLLLVSLVRRSCLVIFSVVLVWTSPARGDLALRYNQPAERWVEALPVGNGRMGAMVFGGVDKEHLQLNEATLWSGAPRDWNNPGARDILPQVRNAIFAGDYVGAGELCKKMQGPYNESYQPLGDLYLTFPSNEYVGYERKLDLDRGVTSIRYRQGNATFTREIFSSFPDQVIVVRLSCDKPAQLSFRASLNSLLHHRTEAALADGRKAESSSNSSVLVLVGKCPVHVDPSYLHSADPIRYEDEGEGMTFDLRVQAIAQGGTVTCDGSVLSVENADAVTLLISAGTSFNGYDKSPTKQGRNPAVEALRPLTAAQARTYPDLLSRHLADYQALFRRVDINLGRADGASSRTIDERLIHFAQGEPDPELCALLYQYGRYLLISSSRPGGLPANLQGIWNDSMRPPWSSNWTLNINAQMNYWPAEVANLSECHEPFFDFIEELAVNGRKTAEINYGAHGWVAHHNADIWAQTAPVGDFGGGDPVWANWAMSAPWLSQHLWEHYAFSQDKNFLRTRAWPVMKGAAEFCLDWLVEDTEGHLVTAPSGSPELAFNTPDGKHASISMACTMDMSIIWDLFTNCIEAASVLDVDRPFAAKLETARAKLYPLKIGSRGQLQEWFKDFAEVDPHHRHTSHLFGVYPGRQITPATPGYFAAALRSLELRGDDGTGWSLGWKINFWARFGDGDHAYRLVRNLLRPVGGKTSKSSGPGGGVYPNLFDAHPPFQIDGNFAFTAGVSEMLLQSHLGELHLLPALPAAWPTGYVSGLRARGGFEVASLTWKDSKLTGVSLKANSSGNYRVRYGSEAAEIKFEKGKTISLDSHLKPLN